MNTSKHILIWGWHKISSIDYASLDIYILNIVKNYFTPHANANIQARESIVLNITDDMISGGKLNMKCFHMPEPFASRVMPLIIAWAIGIVNSISISKSHFKKVNSKLN